MPKKSENSTELNSYIDKLVDMGAKSGSVTEDEIQVVLKDVEVSDAQLTSIYRSLRDHGVEVTSQVDGDDAPIDVDDVDDVDASVHDVLMFFLEGRAARCKDERGGDGSGESKAGTNHDCGKSLYG